MLRLSLVSNFFIVAKSGKQAADIYQQIVATSRHPAFYTTLGIADNRDMRLELLYLHVFLVMHAWRQDKTHKALSQALFNVTMDDLDQNLREMGVGDLAVGKKVRALAEIMYGRFKQYKDALADPHPGTLQHLLVDIFGLSAPNAAHLGTYCQQSLTDLEHISTKAALPFAVQLLPEKNPVA